MCPPFCSDTLPREIGNEYLWYHRFLSKFVACASIARAGSLLRVLTASLGKIFGGSQWAEEKGPRENKERNMFKIRELKQRLFKEFSSNTNLVASRHIFKKVKGLTSG